MVPIKTRVLDADTRRANCRRFTALVAVGLLVVAACGDDETEANPTTTTDGATTVPTAPSTTTTTTLLTEDDVSAMLLQASDVPEDYTGPDNTPVEQYSTEPPACGLGLDPHPETEPDIQLVSNFAAPDGLGLYSHDLQYYADGAEAADLPALREAIAGPCADGFESEFIDGPGQFRFEPLPDPDLGDAALAARVNVDFGFEGHPGEAVIYLVSVQRGTTFSVVQVTSVNVPSADLTGPDLGLPEALRVAEAIDQRVAARLG